MSGLITNLGLQVMLDRSFNINGPPAAIQTLSVDDSTTAIASGTTTLGSPTNLYAQAFDVGGVTRSSQTVSALTTISTANANFVVKRCILHNIAAGSVTGVSATVIGGVDGQSLTKSVNFSLAVTVNVLGSSP